MPSFFKIVLLLNLLIPYQAHAAKFEVVTSVGPLYSIVKTLLMGVDQVNVTLLVNKGDIHNTNLTPKNARQIASANRVYWFGPSVEHGMTEAIENLAEGRQITLLNQALGEAFHYGDESVNLLSHDDYDSGDTPEHIHQAEELERGGHRHPWLNLYETSKIISFIATDLSGIYSDSSELIKNNKAALLQSIQKLDQQNRIKIKKIRSSHYISDHPFLNDFSYYFKLGEIPGIDKSDEFGTSVKRMRFIKEYVDTNDVKCLLSSNPRLIPGLKNLFPTLEITYVDVLGITYDYDYIALMQGVIDTMLRCAND